MGSIPVRATNFLYIYNKIIKNIMAFKIIQIENHFAYNNNSKRAKRTSHKKWKQERNKKQRRKINSNLDYVPEYKKSCGTEF